MSLKFITSTFTSLLILTTGFSQIFSDKSVTAPPETANEFMGNIHHNINYQTGALNFSLRLLSLKVDDDYEIPIEITYNGKGVKFDQKNGEVAVGWGLSSNFKVNRTIYGRPDEHYPKPSEQTLNDINLSNDHVLRDKQITQFTFGLPSNGGLTLKTGLQILDSEYDIFDYNTPSISGTFIIEDAANKTIASSGNPLIRIDYNVDPVDGIKTLEITDTNGNRYLAGYDSATTSYLSESVPRWGKAASYSWPITNIVTANNKSVKIGYALTDVFEYSVEQLGITIIETNGALPGFPRFMTGFNDETDGSAGNRKSYLTSSITSQYGEIKIFRHSNSQLIDSVVLYNKRMERVKSVKFTRGGDLNHILLDSISIYGKDSQNPKHYSFEYYSKSGAASPDIWGNYKNSSSSLKRYPIELQDEQYWQLTEIDALILYDLPTTPGVSSVSFADRAPSGVPNFYSLKKLTLPTGGTVSYTYQGNFFLNASGQQKQGPGIRLSGMQTFDPITSSLISTVYKYGLNESGIGKIPAQITKYNFGLDQISVQRDPTNGVSFELYGTRRRFFSNDVVSDGDPFFSSYNFVTYPVVKEITPLGAKITYYKPGSNMTWYQNGGQNMSFNSLMLSGDLLTEYRPGFVYEYNFRYEPLIEKIDILNPNGDTIRTQTFEYRLLTPKSFLQMKVKPYGTFDGYFSADHDYVYYGFQSIYDYFLSNMYFGAEVVTKQKTSEKRDGQVITQRVEYDYNADHQLVKDITYLSNGDKRETHYKYPNNFLGLSPNNQLTSDVVGTITSNQLGQWIEKKVYIKKDVNGVETSAILNAEFKRGFPGTNKIRNTYTYVNKNGMPEVPLINISNGLLFLDNYNYKKEPNEIIRVDNVGNILTEIDDNGIMTSYLWGYNGNYPVAKLVGIDYNTASQYVDESVLNAGTDLQIKQELASLRNGFAGSTVQIYTYIYEPSIGVTSVTDANGLSTYYEYDDFGRLESIQDNDKNIIKAHTYHYANEND